MTLQELGYQSFEDLIVTSLEGGSNYWYWLDRDDFEKDLTISNEPLACRLADALYNDKRFKLKVYDCEDEEELLGVVDRITRFTG